MHEHHLPIPSAAPDNVVAKLPPVFRVQSISRLPLDDQYALNRAALFHEHASLMVEWPARKVDARLGAGSLVSIRWLGRPESLGGAVRISRLAVLERPVGGRIHFCAVWQGLFRAGCLVPRGFEGR